MTFSLFQAHLAFHSVYQYLRILPPYSEQSPEDWSGAESSLIKIGDMVFVLEPIFSPWGNSSQGIGVSEGDKFRIAQLILVCKTDSDYPMGLALSADSYEMQFVETVLCVKADIARLAGHGFYYLIARPKKAPTSDDLSQIGQLAKYGNNGERAKPPNQMPEPCYQFLSALHAPLDPAFVRQPIDIEVLGYYLFSDNDAVPAGRAPDLRGFFSPIKRSETPTVEARKPSPQAAEAQKSYASQSLNALLSDDWSPDPSTKNAPPPLPAGPSPAQNSIRGMAAEIASLAMKDGEDSDSKSGNKIQMAPSPGVKAAPAAPAQTPGPGRLSLQPSAHPLKSPPPAQRPAPVPLNQGTAPAPAPAPAPAATPPPAAPGRVPMYGSAGGPKEPPKPNAHKVTLEALFSGESVDLAEVESKPSFIFEKDKSKSSLADGLVDLANATSSESAAQPAAPSPILDLKVDSLPESTSADAINSWLVPTNPAAESKSAPATEIAESAPAATPGQPPPQPSAPLESIFPTSALEAPAPPETIFPAPVVQASAPPEAIFPSSVLQSSAPPEAIFPTAAVQASASAEQDSAPVSTPPPSTQVSEPAPAEVPPAAALDAPPTTEFELELPPSMEDEPAPAPQPVSAPLESVEAVQADTPFAASLEPVPPSGMAVELVEEPAPVQAEAAAPVTQSPVPEESIAAEPEPVAPQSPAESPVTAPAPVPTPSPLPAAAPAAVPVVPVLPPGLASGPGVSGFVAKLEQQAQRATIKLEQKLEQIQLQLQEEAKQHAERLSQKEQANLQNIISLRSVLSSRLSGAGEELKGQIKERAQNGSQSIGESSSSASAGITELGNGLSTEVLQSFDELGQSTLGLASAYAEKAQAQQDEGVAELEKILESTRGKLEAISRQHFSTMQAHHEQILVRLQELNQNGLSDLNSTSDRLVAELMSHKKNCTLRLEELSTELLETIREAIVLCGLNLQLHSDVVGTNVLFPRIMAYKQAIGTSAQRLREQYKEEVEKAATMKMAELRPVLMGHREKMEAIIQTAGQLKASIEVGQKAELEKMLASLSEFVEEKTAEAQAVADFANEELGRIEQSVAALSDPAGIAADPELNAARDQVLSRLEEIGSKLQDNVSETLRRQIAGMEDKSKVLQEELISGMEGDAYAVRKSVETSIAKIKAAMDQAYGKIQALQNQYLQ